MVLSNCTELWNCAFRDWGAVVGSPKLLGMQGGGRWSCFDLEDLDERLDLGAEGCASLVPLAEASHHGRPF